MENQQQNILSEDEEAQLMARAEKRMRNGMWDEAADDMRAAIRNPNDLSFQLGKLESRRFCVEDWLELQDEGLSFKEIQERIWESHDPRIAQWVMRYYQF